MTTNVTYNNCIWEALKHVEDGLITSEEAMRVVARSNDAEQMEFLSICIAEKARYDRDGHSEDERRKLEPPAQHTSEH